MKTLELNMKKYFRKTTSIALISLCGLSLTGLAIAMPNGDSGNMMKRSHFQLEREYTLTEINTLVAAKLLRSRDTEQTLESIEKTESGTFMVQISKASGEDKIIELNVFGAPVDAPIPGLFNKPGGKHSKGGRSNKGWAQHQQGGNLNDPMQSNMRQDNKPFMNDKMTMTDEQKQEKRDAFLQKNALTLEEVTTLAKAKIIRLNQDKLKLGQVTNNDDGGYTVTILTIEDVLVSRIKLNEAGFPEFKKRHHKG